jgi:hypothetical protein
MKQAALLILALSIIAAPFVHGGNQKKDPEAIGERTVDKGVNFYSLQKELALGKQLADALEKDVHTMDACRIHQSHRAKPGA